MTEEKDRPGVPFGEKRLREWHGATLPAQVPLLAAAPKASESLRQEDKGRLRAEW